MVYMCMNENIRVLSDTRTPTTNKQKVTNQENTKRIDDTNWQMGFTKCLKDVKAFPRRQDIAAALSKQ